MTNLRKAAEMAKEVLEIMWATETGFFDNSDKIKATTQALRQALAQPEQEPVAWITPDGEGFRIRFSPPVNDMPLGWEPFYTASPSIEAAVLAEREAIMEICNRHNHPIAGVIHHAIRARGEK